MTRKLAHLLICMAICLLIGCLAPITLGATAQPRALVANSLLNQIRVQPIQPAFVAQARVCRVEEAGPPPPPPSNNHQAGTGRLTTTTTISQPPPLCSLPPSSIRLPSDNRGLPGRAFDSYPRLSAPLSPVKRLDLIGPSAGQVVSHTMRIESTRLQITERVTPTGQVIGAAYAITPTVLTHTSSSGDVRPAAVCMVTSITDSGPGTLRQCLEDAVAGDTITFDAGVFPPTSPATISLSNPLPWIITDSLTIDASDVGVILDGSRLLSGTGFVIWDAHGVKIQGLQIVYFPDSGVGIAGAATNTVIGGDRFTGSGLLGQGNLISGNGKAGIWLEDTGTTGNQILGNFIGTDADGTTALKNLENGIFIGFGASNNVIGGTTPGAGNLISGNGDQGIQIQNVDTTGNQIRGNFIGTDVAGAAALGNLSNGILINFGASNNVVGGTAPGAGNLISGNTVDGILLSGQGTAGNQILGNFIGTDVAGTSALGNLRMGVFIDSAASNNILGGNTIGTRNLIGGNEAIGILLQKPGTTGNQVLGNYIGTDVTGTTALGNFQDGIIISFGATNNIVGGTAPGAGNLISGNGNDGIRIQNSGTTGNQVLGNFIGTDASGAVALGNLQIGIVILAGASNNIVGGSTSAARNLVSGNDGGGIWLQGAGTASNTIQGNFVGTDVTGTGALGNLDEGIQIGFGASNNVIGGASPGAGNLVSGNERVGIWLQSTGTTGNQVRGNFVGTDVDGTGALGNLLAGIFIGFGASNNIIGSTAPGAGNLISGNGDDGIHIQSAGTAGNQILGNFIGTDGSSTAALGNLGDGIFIGFGALNNLVGGETTLAGNMIAFNGGAGVCVDGSQALGNTISHNSIHDNVGLGIETTNGGNTELAPPTIMEVISTSVSGQTQPGYIVEVFSDNDGEGRWFEGKAIADGSGVFTLTYSGVFSGWNLIATATDADGNTSEFSTPFRSPYQERIFLPIIIKNSG
jgi:hypothetical protein